MSNLKIRPIKEDDLMSVIQEFSSKYGIDIHSQIQSNGRILIRNALILMLIWLEMLFSLSTAIFVKNDQPELLGLLNDVAFHCQPPRYRHVSNFFYHSSKMYWPLMFTIHSFDNYKWLVAANNYFNKLSFKITKEIKSLTRKIFWVSFITGTCLPITCTVTSLIVMMLNDKGNVIKMYSSWFSRSYILTIIATYATYSAFKFSEFYLLCRLCIMCIDQYNERMLQLLCEFRFRPDLELTQKRLWNHCRKFPILITMIQELKIYMNRAFAILIICTATSMIPQLYTVFFSNTFSTRIVVFGVFFVHLVGLIYCSGTAGSVESRAKCLADKIYETFIFDRNNDRIFLKHVGHEVIKYFNCVYKVNIGVELLNTSVNVEAALKFSTFFFTILTIVLKNIIWKKTL